MNHTLDAIFLVLFLIVAVWLVVFGTAGVLLAGPAGVRRSLGLVIGGLLGPFGVAWLALRGRHAVDLDRVGIGGGGDQRKEGGGSGGSGFRI